MKAPGSFPWSLGSIPPGQPLPGPGSGLPSLGQLTSMFPVFYSIQDVLQFDKILKCSFILKEVHVQELESGDKTDRSAGGLPDTDKGGCERFCRILTIFAILRFWHLHF